MPPSLSSLLQPKTKEDTLVMMGDALAGLYPVEKEGLGSGVLTLTGTPTAAYVVVVEVTTAGNLSTVRIRYSLDGGTTWAASNVLVPANGQVALGSTGVTLNFAPGTTPTSPAFLLGDSFSFELVVPTFQVRSWQPFDTGRVLLETVAVALASFYRLIRNAIAGGFGRYASDEWVDVWAYEFYDEERREGAQAKHRVVLTDVLGSGPHAITAGKFWVVSSTGKRFTAEETVTLPKDGTVSLTVVAESAGSDFNVAIGSIQTLITTLPGVTVSNPDMGNGTSLVQQGTNRETRDELYQRCRLKWNTLSKIGTDGLYEYWAKNASTQVTRVAVLRSLTVAGEVDVVLAGPSGGVSSAVVGVVDAALQDNALPLTNTINTQSAVNYVLPVTATLWCQAGYEGTVVAAAESALVLYLQTVPLGGKVRDGAMIAALMSASGMVDVDLTWPGDIQLLRTQVVVPGTMTLTPSIAA